jgi:two-component system chemotaxis response regulator CheB
MMAPRDVVVIGCSAGGVQALKKIVRQFPANLAAAVFIVVHIPAQTRSWLPEILNMEGVLVARHAQDGEGIVAGRIYVAPPDRHLVLGANHVHLNRGPKEQYSRPCINVTFRSAASCCGDRAIGVVLTGELDDGAAGLWELKRRGGIAIVQNPEEAASPSMPLRAVREVETDYILRIGEIGRMLTVLVNGLDCRTSEVESVPSVS